MIQINVAFTRYLEESLTLFASGSLPIGHISIHIRKQSNQHSDLYQTLLVLEYESNRKCENKYNIDDIQSVSDLFTSLAIRSDESNANHVLAPI